MTFCRSRILPCHSYCWSRLPSSPSHALLTSFSKSRVAICCARGFARCSTREWEQKCKRRSSRRLIQKYRRHHGAIDSPSCSLHLSICNKDHVTCYRTPAFDNRSEKDRRNDHHQSRRRADQPRALQRWTGFAGRSSSLVARACSSPSSRRRWCRTTRIALVQAPYQMNTEHHRLLEQAVTVPSAATHALGEACRQAGMVVSIGVNESAMGARSITRSCCSMPTAA
jgi:hypothetical protein